MSNSTKITNDSNTSETYVTTIIPLTSILREAKRVTTEMTKILVNATTTPSTTTTTIGTTIGTTIQTTAAPTTIPTTTAKTTEPYTEAATIAKQATRLSLNLTKTTAASNIANTTSKVCTSTTTVDPFDEFGPPEGVEYIFVPLGVMIFVIVLSAVVLIISRRRKLERLRHRLMPLYNFDPGEEGEDDWETELLDEGLGNRQRRQRYQSIDSEENTELFGPH